MGTANLGRDHPLPAPQRRVSLDKTQQDRTVMPHDEKPRAHTCIPVPVPGERGELTCASCGMRYRLFLVPRDHSGTVMDIPGARRLSLEEIRDQELSDEW